MDILSDLGISDLQAKEGKNTSATLSQHQSVERGKFFLENVSKLTKSNQKQINSNLVLKDECFVCF